MTFSKRSFLFAFVLVLLVFTVPAAASYTGSPTIEAANPSSDAITTGITTVALNLRPEPNTNRPRIALIPKGATIDVYGRNAAKTWLSVAYQNKQGWVSAPYVTLASGSVSDLPIIGSTSSPSQEPVSSGQYTGHIYNVGPHLDSTYQYGLQIGKNPHAFTKVGDCEMEFRWFLQDFDAGVYNLGDYQYLQKVVTQFSGSFAHQGEVANAGMSSSAIFQEFWADPALCKSDETPLACEYRTHKPIIALMMLRTINKDAVTNGQFHYEVNKAVTYSLSQGVIPVLQTIPYWGPTNPDTEAMNDVIRQVANENNVPLWDYWVTSEQLPNRGVTSDYHIDRPADGNGTTLFTDDRMQIAANRRNLEALEVLHAILKEVQ